MKTFEQEKAELIAKEFHGMIDCGVEESIDMILEYEDSEKGDGAITGVLFPRRFRFFFVFLSLDIPFIVKDVGETGLCRLAYSEAKFESGAGVQCRAYPEAC